MKRALAGYRKKGIGGKAAHPSSAPTEAVSKIYEGGGLRKRSSIEGARVLLFFQFLPFSPLSSTISSLYLMPAFPAFRGLAALPLPAYEEEGVYYKGTRL